MLVKEPTIPPTHVSIADHPAFPNPNSTEILQTVHEAILVDPFRQRPMLLGDDFVKAFCQCEALRLLLVFDVSMGKAASIGNLSFLKRQSHLKLVAKRLVVEEDPWIAVFAIPVELEAPHALHHAFQFRVADQAD